MKQGYGRHGVTIPIGTKDHLCHLCGKGFFHKHQLERHNLVHIGYDERPNSKALICDQCGKHFRTPGGLARHTRQHQGAFKCELCQKVFGSQNDLTRHIKSHVEQSDHTCHLCGKGLVDRYEL